MKDYYLTVLVIGFGLAGALTKVSRDLRRLNQRIALLETAELRARGDDDAKSHDRAPEPPVNLPRLPAQSARRFSAGPGAPRRLT